MDVHRGEPLYARDQAAWGMLGQGAMDDDYEDHWAASEGVIRAMAEEHLIEVRDDIKYLFTHHPDPSDRLRLVNRGGQFTSTDEVDQWRHIVISRIEHALAGIHDQPIVDPLDEQP